MSKEKKLTKAHVLKPLPKQYITTPELMELFGVSQRTIYRWKQKGKLSYGKKIGVQCVYTPEEVQALRDTLGV